MATRPQRKFAAATSHADELLALLDQKAELLKLICSCELGPDYAVHFDRLCHLDSQIAEVRQRMTSQ